MPASERRTWCTLLQMDEIVQNTCTTFVAGDNLHIQEETVQIANILELLVAARIAACISKRELEIAFQQLTHKWVVLQKLPQLSDTHFPQELNKLEKNFFHGFITHHLPLHFI